MHNKLLKLWDRLRSSYWFIPAIMAGSAVVLAVVSVQFDERITHDAIDSLSIIYINSPEGAREVLSTVASGMITVAGVVFSLTMVVLSLTSQQYGPLVLENFMRDRANQIVLGTFTATFIYCLLVLRTVRGVEDDIFVPHLSSLIGVLLAIASMAVLIYFIHHVSDSIKPYTILSRIMSNFHSVLDDLFPAEFGTSARELKIERPEAHLPPDFNLRARAIRAHGGGYLQLIDSDALIETTKRHDVLITLDHRPGMFVAEGTVLGHLYPPERANQDLIKAINEAVVFGNRRTQTQDIEFLFNQIVGIALRALSPSLNDPFTAMMCGDRLGHGLIELANRDRPSRYRYDDGGVLRVVAHPFEFDHLLHDAFDQIRQYGGENPTLVAHLLKTLRQMNEGIRDEDARRVVRAYAADIHAEAAQRLWNAPNADEIEDHYQAIIAQG